MAKNEVAKAETTALALGTDADAFGAFAGEGLENVTANDILIPRIGIAQALSPQMNKKKPEYIEGCEIGDIIDVGTSERFADGIVFIPVLYRKEYLEWAPRESGEGLQAIHEDPSVLDLCTPNDRKQPVLPNGNIIVETAQFYGLNVTAGRRPSFIPMASTMLKIARRWNTLATGEKIQRADGSEFTAPLFYRSYKLTTAEESNNKGEWSVFKIERGQTLPELCTEFGWDLNEMIAACKKLKDDINAGKAKADTTGLGGESAPAGDDDGAM